MHVLGGGKGESIVLKLPDGQWGVVDCHSESVTDPDANPTTQFLRSRGVKTLLFVCLTHPHDDHFLGMVKLIEEFQPREFWRFGALSPVHIKSLLKYNELRAKKASARKQEELTRSATELFELFRIAREAANRRTMRVCRLGSRMPLYPLLMDPPQTYHIECVSPTGRQVERYEGAVLDCIAPDNTIAKKLPRSQHNDISVVLKIVYGKTQIILGGDLEKGGWEDVVAEYGGANLKASAVKVSHHGSENGYCDGLWDSFARGGRPIAVIAPRHRYKLPKEKALDHIFQNAEVILTTCKPRIEWSMPRVPGRLRPSLEDRMTLRNQLSAVPVATGTPCGRCSLGFDDNGNVVRFELIKPAVSLNRNPPAF